MRSKADIGESTLWVFQRSGATFRAPRWSGNRERRTIT